MVIPLYIAMVITQISNNRRASAVRSGWHSQFMEDLLRSARFQLEEVAQTLDEEGHVAVENGSPAGQGRGDSYLSSKSVVVVGARVFRFCQRSHEQVDDRRRGPCHASTVGTMVESDTYRGCRVQFPVVS